MTNSPLSSRPSVLAAIPARADLIPCLNALFRYLQAGTLKPAIGQNHRKGGTSIMQRLTGMFVIVGLIAALALAAAPANVSEAKDGFPSIINLPNGHQPEGIAIGKGTTFLCRVVSQRRGLSRRPAHRHGRYSGARRNGAGGDRPLRGRAPQLPVCLGRRQRAGLRLRCAIRGRRWRRINSPRARPPSSTT